MIKVENLVNSVMDFAKIFPDKKAIITPHDSFTFKEFIEHLHQAIFYFQRHKIPKNSKVLFLVKANRYFPVLAYACFSYGLIPTFIDPQMGLKNLYHSIKKSDCQYLFASPILLFLSFIFPTIKFRIYFKNIFKNKFHSNFPMDLVHRNPQDEVCVIFTSGGTGTPKPISYTQMMLQTQKTILRDVYRLTPQDIDAAGFPLFSLFTIGLGMTSSYLPMNPTKAAKCDGSKIAKWLIDQKITFAAGSPAIWKNLIKKSTLSFPHLKSLVMFGAPVPISLIENLLSRMNDSSDVYTPYGATEALPLTNISGRSVINYSKIKTQEGHGICVGRPLDHAKIEIRNFYPDTKVGEIWVQSPVVTPSSKNYPWHFMGDLGYLDENNYLWFCGRQVHAFQSHAKWFFPVMLEAKYLKLDTIDRCALVPYKSLPLLIIDSKDKNIILKEELDSCTHDNDMLKVRHYFYYNKFPVDARHNIKVDRIKLAKMVSKCQINV